MDDETIVGTLLRPVKSPKEVIEVAEIVVAVTASWSVHSLLFELYLEVIIFEGVNPSKSAVTIVPVTVAEKLVIPV